MKEEEEEEKNTFSCCDVWGVHYYSSRPVDAHSGSHVAHVI